MTSQFQLKKMRVAVATGLMLTFVSMQNCSGVGFGKASESSGGGGSPGVNGTGDPNVCNETQLQQITTPVKVLLVVDTSESNRGGTQNGVTYPGTDPGKAMRAGSIQTFFNDFGGKPNFNWGFITFAGTMATAIIANNGNPSSPAFTSSSSVMQNAINYFKTYINDDGVTPYRAAINMATAAIANDPADSPQTKYIVVFLSDGLPTDYGNYPNINDSQIIADVQGLVGLKPGRVSFSSVYYGPRDAAASGRLHNMANAGGGQFLDTNANPAAKDFVINNVVTVPGTTCPH